MEPAVVLRLRHRTIGALLRAQRQEARWSVRQLSDRVGIPASRISSYERGERGIPLVDLVPLAEAVGHTVEEYLDESGPLADRDSAERVGRAVTGFPPELRRFLTAPDNLPYLRLALRLSQLPPDQLRQVAEDLQVLVP
jgi:transcriptional regulator with XRE-family HTH domain